MEYALTNPRFTFTDALAAAKARYEAHPMWKRLDGTPWANDAPVIAAELMIKSARTCERFECAKALAYLIPSITEDLGVLTEHIEEACADPLYRVALVAAATPYIDCVLRHTGPTEARDGGDA